MTFRIVEYESRPQTRMSDHNNTAQSVERAFAVLNLLRDSEAALSVSDIARALKLSPPTVHRFLTTLRKCKVVEQDLGTRRYHLGLELLLYSKVVLDRFDWRSRAHPLLGELSKDVGERNDLAGQRQDIARHLRPLLDAWEADVDAGAKTNAAREPASP